MEAFKLGLTGTIIAVVSYGVASAGTTLKPLYSFRGGHANSNPLGDVIFDAQGNIFSTLSSQQDTKKGAVGSVFELSPPAPGLKSWTETEIARFDSNEIGAHPLAGLVADPTGALYGTTSEGQTSLGTVFKLLPPTGERGAWTLQTLYGFTESGPGPIYPYAGVVLGADGALYGTTQFTNHGAEAGSVFKLAPPGKFGTDWILSDLHDFVGGADGARPVAPLVKGAGRTFFGTTSEGGGGTLCAGTSGCGTVFEIAAPAKGQTVWTETVLYSFTGAADGSQPEAGLILDRQGNLYGTTVIGGDTQCIPAGCGVVFELSPPESGQTVWTQTVLYTFHGTDGIGPSGSLAFDKLGNLYGTTIGGGAQQRGAVFKLSPPPGGNGAWTETTVFDLNTKIGCYPVASVTTDAAGAIYGTASQCGSRGFGTVFKIKP